MLGGVMAFADAGDSGAVPRGARESDAAVTLELRVSEFTVTELQRQADRQRVPVEELAAHALAYYLADADSGRVAWPVPSVPERPED
jgi:hypothetical protein